MADSQTTPPFYRDADDAAWRVIEKRMANNECWACGLKAPEHAGWCPEIWPEDCRNG